LPFISRSRIQTFSPGRVLKFVQDRLWHDRADVMPLIAQEARIYVCGNGKQMRLRYAPRSVACIRR